MNFNPDTSKQAQEVIFSRKVKVTAHLQLIFSNNPVHETATQKHLGMFLDFKLNFQEHFENMLNKVNKTIGLLRKLQNTLVRQSLLTFYKTFMRPHLDYGDIVYDQAYLESLQHRRWYRKLTCFYKILKDQSAKNLFDTIPQLTRP